MGPAGRLKPSFRGFIGDWLKASAPVAPIVMAGMVGSKLGWREAPYAATPAKFSALAQNLIALPDLDGHPVRIAPGLSARADGRPDVMRGEECQLYGLWLLTLGHPSLRAAGDPFQVGRDPRRRARRLPHLHDRRVVLAALRQWHAGAVDEARCACDDAAFQRGLACQ